MYQRIACLVSLLSLTVATTACIEKKKIIPDPKVKVDLPKPGPFKIPTTEPIDLDGISDKAPNESWSGQWSDLGDGADEYRKAQLNCDFSQKITTLDPQLKRGQRFMERTTYFLHSFGFYLSSLEQTEITDIDDAKNEFTVKITDFRIDGSKSKGERLKRCTLPELKFSSVYDCKPIAKEDPSKEQPGASSDNSSKYEFCSYSDEGNPESNTTTRGEYTFVNGRKFHGYKVVRAQKGVMNCKKGGQATRTEKVEKTSTAIYVDQLPSPNLRSLCPFHNSVYSFSHVKAESGETMGFDLRETLSAEF